MRQQGFKCKCLKTRYNVNASRLDIMQAVGLGARFQATPKETHVQAAKGIFIFLKGTLDFGLWYPWSDDMTLGEYTDTYWGRSIDWRRSTSVAVHSSYEIVEYPGSTKNNHPHYFYIQQKKYIFLQRLVVCKLYGWNKC